MDTTDTDPETIRILNTVFADVEGDRISRKDVLDRISLKTYYNYGPALYKAGLAKPVKVGRKFTHIQLTAKGKQLRSEGDNKASERRKPSSKSASLLEEITKLTDDFNNQTPSWEWKLVRKGGVRQ